MTRNGKTTLAAALLLAACQTTQASYEAPLRAGGALPASSAGVTTVDVAVDEDGFRHEGHSYRLQDLAPSARPPASTDEAGLWLITDKAEGQIRYFGRRVRDPELERYVGDIVCKLADKHCAGVRTYIMRVPALNASMMPNGTMQVWTGLLLRTRNEAQLASVLGHEIGHYLRRHTVQRFRAIRDTSGALVFLRLAAAAAGVAPLGDLAALIATGQLQAYNREHEREADGYGLLLLFRNSYDTREAHKLWQTVIDESAADPDGRLRDPFTASHPPREERRDVLSALGDRLVANIASPELGADRYWQIIGPRRGVWLRDEVERGDLERSSGLFDDMLAAGDPNPAEILYFKGELHRLRDDDGDAEAALALYDDAVAAAGTAPADLHRSRGLLLNRAGDTAAAAAAFRRYLGSAPDASDRLIVEDMIRRLETT